MVNKYGARVITANGNSSLVDHNHWFNLNLIGTIGWMAPRFVMFPLWTVHPIHTTQFSSAQVSWYVTQLLSRPLLENDKKALSKTVVGSKAFSFILSCQLLTTCPLKFVARYKASFGVAIFVCDYHSRSFS